MATTKKPTKRRAKRPGATTTQRLTDVQRRMLRGEIKRLEQRVTSLKNTTRTADASKVLGRLVKAIKRAANSIEFA